MPTATVGLVWYRRADYARALDMMADAHDLPETFDAWKRQAKAIEDRLKREGFVSRRVIIDLDAFAIWCVLNGRERDGPARSSYVANPAHWPAAPSAVSGSA